MASTSLHGRHSSAGLFDDLHSDDLELPVLDKASYAPTAAAGRSARSGLSRFSTLRANFAMPSLSSPRILVVTSVIAQAIPLLLITMIFVAGTWLSFALQHKHNLSPGDWDRLYQLVGQKILRPRNWLYFSVVLAFALVQLLMMVWSQWQRGNHRARNRSFHRVYVMIHLVGGVFNILMLFYIIDGGIKVIHEHIMGPENFLKSWL